MATLDDLYAQFLGVMPAGDAMMDAPLMGPFGAPMPPFSGDPGGFAMPFAMGETPESEVVDPMLGVTPAFGATTTAGAQYGYSPQPRPALPAPIADPAANLYGPFRGVWERMQAEPDPLAALMTPAPEPAPPLMLSAPPNAQGRQMAPAMAARPPSPQEMLLRARGYGRAVDRVNQLDRLRAVRGY